MDQTRGAILLQEAAREGNIVGEYLWGICLVDGLGVPASLEEGTQWIRSAATKGLPMAMYHLACLYGWGLGLPRDSCLESEWKAKATKAGYVASGDLVSEHTIMSLGLPGSPFETAHSSRTRKESKETGHPEKPQGTGVVQDGGRSGISGRESRREEA